MFHSLLLASTSIPNRTKSLYEGSHCTSDTSVPTILLSILSVVLDLLSNIMVRLLFHCEKDGSGNKKEAGFWPIFKKEYAI